MSETLWSIVDDEARHDWLDHRLELERDARPEPAEYRETKGTL